MNHISVVINTFNAERHLERVLRSVKDFDEILVCDMHSTDRTIAIAREYGCTIVYHDHTGFRVHRNRLTGRRVDRTGNNLDRLRCTLLRSHPGTLRRHTTLCHHIRVHWHSGHPATLRHRIWIHRHSLLHRRIHSRLRLH